MPKSNPKPATSKPGKPGSAIVAKSDASKPNAPVVRSLTAHREHVPVRGARASKPVVLTANGKKMLVPERYARSAQISLVLGALAKLGKNATVASIADAIRPKLETVQTAERVVGFYVATWRKAGLLE